jgi:DNA repair exonuclease SbcCD ATPase subunit
MSEETENRSPLHQVEELWKQWYDTSSKVWSEASIPTDPFTFFKQWYESSQQTWSTAIEEIISNEQFVEAASHYMESYTTFYKNFRNLNEDYFSHLQLTTRSDVTRVAEMIISLENKVDSIQDACEDLQTHYPHLATLASIQPLESHLHSLQQQLDHFPATFKKIDDDLHKHLHTVEDKLDAIPLTLQKLDALPGLEQRLVTIENRLGELPSTLQKLDALPGLEQRLTTIEGRLDQLPSALQKLDALQGLDARLHSIEEKLHTLPATLTHHESSGQLEKRLDGVEQKLDKLVTLLEDRNTQQPVTKATATRTSRSSSAKTRTTPKTPEMVLEDTPSSTVE